MKPTNSFTLLTAPHFIHVGAAFRRPHSAARMPTHLSRIAQTRHPERSGPAFFFAPLFGAPGRVAEGSPFDLNMSSNFPTKARP
ncbi:MAG: hypothetical protein WCE52_17655 [Candidatus Acidiferrum sp.]